MPSVGFDVRNQLVSSFKLFNAMKTLVARHAVMLQQMQIQLDRIAVPTVALLNAARIQLLTAKPGVLNHLADLLLQPIKLVDTSVEQKVDPDLSRAGKLLGSRRCRTSNR